VSDLIVRLRNGRVVYPRPKWYGSIRVLRDGRMRFSPWAFDEANRVTIRYGSPDSSHSVYISGRQVMLLFPRLGKLASACFIYTLTAEELVHAVDTLSKITGGLESWIIPALESTLGTLAGVRRNPQPNYPDVVAVIPHLLEAYRDLPVAEIWQRRRRQTQEAWAKHLRKHPGELSKISAPWMLPEGYQRGDAATGRISRT
jgi:hypothetical protein